MNPDKIDPLAEKSVDAQINELVEEEIPEPEKEALGELHNLL